jgi:osmotically-inducible protein OsmY
MGEGAIREAVLRALLGESVLAYRMIRARAKGVVETLRGPADATGRIEVSVADGVVTLDGKVAGLGRKRLAGVLAWFVPGSRDVINGLGVKPPETDSDAAIADAVRQVIEADPAVESESIQVTVQGAVVALDGTVRQASERAAAESDAWYVFGVDDVINRLIVRP